jgi:ATP-dependent Clp protease, protease subunit
MPSTWFKARSGGGSVGELNIYSDIGQDGVTSEAFYSKLTAMRGVSTLAIGIDSNGGDVTTGMAITNMLRRHPAKKIVRIDGIAASMASVIAMVGDEVIMPSNAMMMIHNPYGGVTGEGEQIKSFGGALLAMRENIIGEYMKKTGLDAQEIGAMMDRETWLTAEQAVKLGFADKIEAPLKMAALAKRPDVSMFKNAPPIERGWDAIQEQAFATFNRKAGKTAAGTPMYRKDGKWTLSER